MPCFQFWQECGKACAPAIALLSGRSGLGVNGASDGEPFRHRSLRRRVLPVVLPWRGKVFGRWGDGVGAKLVFYLNYFK